ncbi:uncharacterized protein LOC143893775 [Temnothorax americanus]|uniref:uncharacterized protein LOC143893775 n=1 Tax=Temnothorax americanus TaxID=1964332 RepID=UPI00406966C6
MVYWIYTAILRPRLLYASVVWWPRTQMKTARTALEHVRALILRGALGAMRTTPVAAMGVLLGIEPLHQVVVAAAAAAAYRLKCELKWKVGARHTRIPGTILASPVFTMRQDRKPAIRVFERKYRVCFPEREEWKDPKGLNAWNGDIWFTDGSRSGAGSGAGLYCPRDGTKEIVPLDKFATVFQAETVAIMRCAQTLLERKQEGGRIRICLDSGAALRALCAPNFTSRLVWDCSCTLEKLARNNEVTLIWVPGHSGIKGNETADQLARAGSETRLLGPEPAVGIPYSLSRREIRGWLRNQHLDYWKRETRVRCRQARALLGDSPKEELASSIRSLNRKDARLVVQLLTGHGVLNYHMYKLGRSSTPDCRLCGEEEETSLHILGQCPAYARRRLVTLGSAFLEPEQIRQLPVEDLLRFWRETGLP